MSDIVNVLQKVFVKEFYRLNAGFFILIITLTFGFMSGREHRALAEFFISAPILLTIPFGIWMLYGLKIHAFNKQRIAKAENRFLFDFTLLQKKTQFISLSVAFVAQFAPVIAYAFFLILVAAKNNFISSVISIIIGGVLLVLIFVFAFNFAIAHPVREKKVSVVKRFIDAHTVRPIWWIYLTSILRQEPVLIIATKVFTCLLLYSITRLYLHDTLDVRLLAMATALAAVANFSVLRLLQQFDFSTLVIMKNVPWSTVRRWCINLLVIAMAMLPEFVFVIKYSSTLRLMDNMLALLIMPSLAALLFSMNFLNFKNDETHPRIVFGMTILHMGLILFNVPLIIFIALDVIASYIIFKSEYYLFEYRVIPK